MTPEKLCELAREAMTHAYVPYSGYQVGAALLCADGTVYQGCNIENASYSPTVCAERTAFFKAVYDGHRDFAAIAVCGGKDGVITGAFPPCGVCRQVMREFCGDDFLIYMITPEGCEAHTLAEILPFSFSAQKHMHTSRRHREKNRETIENGLIFLSKCATILSVYRTLPRIENYGGMQS